MEISKGYSTLCTFGLLSDRTISAFDAQVYLYVKFRWQFFNSIGKEFMESRTTMAEFFGVKINTIRLSLATLVDRGYLVKKVRAGKPTVYALPDKEKWMGSDHV